MMTEVAVSVSAINADGLCIPAMDIKIKYDPSIVAATGVANTAFLADYRFNGTLFYIEAIMPEESADIRIASTEFNVLSGLDWRTNLGNKIEVSHIRPTLTPGGYKIYLPIIQGK